jgi:hypothetical protein
MGASECTWCGAEIEDGGLPYKGLIFCSTDCKEDWDDDNLDVDDIDLDEFEERDLLADELEEFEGELPLDEEDEF